MKELESNKKGYKSILLWLPVDLHTELKSTAKLFDTSMSKLIKGAIKEKIESLTEGEV